ncbi:MAG TPA: neutral/alkaline non-lysosomal ceramidase N-terminal domain-containing protein [Gemmatimonadales bacterium]|nr:neutral/alkaline non-lysosomal ceramidase N-terminal domain-containing protein [Gemmatimonadales bacterium]
MTRMPAAARWAVLGLTLAAGGCAGGGVASFPVHVSPASSPAPGSLRGGVARVDLTPSVGLGLLGYGPEGKRAAGWRQRLYARALVLEDGDGERLAIVTADLGHVSRLLALSVAERTEAAGIGADRLLLSATHTHSGPAHFHGVLYYDEFGSSVGGYDPGLVQFLAERIAGAVVEAAGRLRPARATWGADSVWGCARIRSMVAYDSNPPHDSEFPDEGRLACSRSEAREYREIDPTLTLLRVDLRDPASGAFRPAAAYTVFAVHNTVNSGASDLYDADVHGVIARGLERTAGDSGGAEPEVVHLVANGASGDVSPDVRVDARCQPPVVEPERRPRGPRAPRGAYVWWRRETRDLYRICRWGDPENLRRIGSALARRAAALHERLGAELSDGSAGWRIARASEVIGFGDACPDPLTGGPLVVGGEEGRTRLKPRGRRWKVLGVIDLGLDTLARAGASRAGDCQYPKDTRLGRLGRTFVGSRALPDSAPVFLARVGPRALIALPFEVTTTSGRRIRDSAAAGLSDPAAPAGSVTLVGLANGYNSYLATAEEYQAQAYEGASTLYGAGTQAAVARAVARLARALSGAASGPGGANGDTIRIHLPHATRRFRGGGSEPDGAVPRLRAVGWKADTARDERNAVTRVELTLAAEWEGEPAAGYIPAGRVTLRVEREAGGEWRPEVWDDDVDLEVRSLGGRRWLALWRPPERSPGRCRVRVLGQGGAPDAISAPFDCGGR